MLPAALRAAGEATVQVIDLSTPDTVVIRDAGIPLPTPGTLESDSEESDTEASEGAEGVEDSADDTP